MLSALPGCKPFFPLGAEQTEETVREEDLGNLEGTGSLRRGKDTSLSSRLLLDYTELYTA